MSIAEIELLIDKKYLNTPLPHPNRSLAIWHFLTAAEDALRLTLARRDISTGSIEYFVDRAKYSLKYGLERIEKESRNISSEHFPRRLIGPCYERGFHLLDAGLEHSVGCQICSSVHNETVALQESEGLVTLKVDEKYHAKGYAVLEMLGHQPDGSVSFMQIILWLLHHNEDTPFIVEKIASTVKVKGKLISYKYDSYLAGDLSLLFAQSPQLIPADWQFSWGGRYETTLLLNALSIRCAYHFIAIHFGAIAKGLCGGGCDDLVLVARIEVLCLELEMLSSLPASTIRKFVDELVYGKGVKSPDPALQPFCQLSKGLLAIPPLHVLSCHMERNLLALHARTQASKFDAMSFAFERDMIAAIVQKLSPHWPQMKPNFTWKFKGEKEEFDLIVADPCTNSLLVCEMRWTIQPGDPREVAQRKKNCFEKVSQLERKIEWLKPHLHAAVTEIFGIETILEKPWMVVGLVVVDGFGGVMSPNDDLPIMPARIFERAMEQVESLQVLKDWSKSLAWLPQEDVFFEMKRQELELEGKRINYEGMSPLQERPDFLQHVDSTIKAVKTEFSRV